MNYQDKIEGHGRRARAGHIPPRDTRLLYLSHNDRTAKGPDRKASWSLGLESNGGARGGCGWYLRQAPPHPPTKVTPDIYWRASPDPRRSVRISDSPGGINNHPVIYTRPIRLC